MDYQTIRALTLDVAKNEFRRTEVMQLVDIINRIEATAVSRGLIQSTMRVSPGVTVDIRMSQEDRELTRQVLWDFVLEGLLFPGASADQPDVHFLKRTSYGREVFETAAPTPYDPDGYLATLRSSIPDIDPTALIYITEALQTFLRGNLLASTVMLGVASEKMILTLIQEYTDAIQNPTRKSSAQSRFDSKFSIIGKFQLLRSEFALIAGVLRTQVATDLDIQLDGVFNLIRNTRNEAGHPTGVVIDRRRAYANLMVFISYCQTVYQLISYFHRNPVQ